MSNWLPGTREGQINTANVWLDVIPKRSHISVPTEDVTDLSKCTADASAILKVAQSADRTPVVTTECQRLFTILIDKMRFIKDRYFKSPPLVDEDYTALLLKIPDHTKTPRGEPKAQRTAEIGRAGTAMLILHYKYAEGTEALANPHTDIRNQVRYGLLPPPGADPSGTDLTKVPTVPEELPIVFASQRRKDVVYFTPSDSGKTCYFEIRIENGHNGYGPWCPMFHAVIP